MTDEPDDYEILLEGYEAALGNDVSALQARIKELEAKLAKALEALEKIADPYTEFRGHIARTTFAELTGGKDE